MYGQELKVDSRLFAVRFCLLPLSHVHAGEIVALHDMCHCLLRFTLQSFERHKEETRSESEPQIRLSSPFALHSKLVNRAVALLQSALHSRVAHVGRDGLCFATAEEPFVDGSNCRQGMFYRRFTPCRL